jgi:RNA polymerase sigma-70 factor (ECF subfamily)
VLHPINHSVEYYFTLLKNGDEKGFTHFFNANYEALIRFAFTLLKDKEGAEDIVEDSFIKLWERRNTLKNIVSLKSYLYTMVRNACLDEIESRRRIGLLWGEVKTVSTKHELPVLHSIIEAEVFQLIHSAIKTLPPKCREVFNLFYRESKTIKEIAAELNIEISTVKNQKQRALKLLRERLPNLNLF